jgi:hypothetical protein
MIRTTSRIALSLLVPVGLTVGAGGLQAQEAMAELCTASFSQESISVQAEPVMLIATLSQEIGDIEKAMSAEESGIVVNEVKASEKGIAVYLDTSKAVAGEWKLGFKSAEGACGGTVKVEAAEEMKEKQEKKAPKSRRRKHPSRARVEHRVRPGVGETRGAAAGSLWPSRFFLVPRRAFEIDPLQSLEFVLQPAETGVFRLDFRLEAGQLLLELLQPAMLNGDGVLKSRVGRLEPPDCLRRGITLRSHGREF